MTFIFWTVLFQILREFKHVNPHGDKEVEDLSKSQVCTLS
jgi:hypothetical protein